MGTISAVTVDQESLEAIRAAIDEGEASGEPQPFDFDEFLKEMRVKAAAKSTSSASSIGA